ncbi:MAG TPA: PAS domain S-box protein [Burkholderiales bacterium]|nr:PAS domain S-box protein [Burkholderiales bacterium]
MAKPRQAKATRRAEEAEADIQESAVHAAFGLLERLPVPMFLKSSDGRYIGVNRAWEDLFGVERESFLGKQVRDLYPHNPEIAERHALKDRELYEHPGAQSYETPIVTADGRRRNTIYYKATFPAGGRPGGLVGAILDVTGQHDAEARLKESEARFRRTFELAGSGMAHIGMDRRFIRVNRRLCEILGYSEEELLGLTGRQISHPDDLDVINEQRPRLYAGEIDAVRVEKRYLRKDGSVVWVHFSMTVERDDAGAPLYEIAVFEDITAQLDAQLRLRDSEARYRQTFELAASGICHVKDGRFVRVNKRLCEILGYPEHNLLGRHVKDISHPEDRDVTDADRARIRNGEIESARFEKRYLRADGTVVWCRIAIALVRDVFGMPTYEVAVFDDITERKKAEAALQEAHEELKRSNAELEQFAYVASHDLQEPLRMVASYTQLLARRYDERLDSDAREFMAYVVDGASRMKQLIEDLLAYSRVGTKGIAFANVSAEAALRRALFNLRGGIEEAGAVVTHDPMPALPADEVQLGQLFQNLIGNALKFRSEGAPRIHIVVTESAPEFTFEVRDNGIGIEPQYFERIFMVFQRLHNKGEYPGTGIGLAICKKVVERHGGRIWVESRPGEGSSFFFTLPKERRNG